MEGIKVATSRAIAIITHRSIVPEQSALNLEHPRKIFTKGKTNGKKKGRDLASVPFIIHRL